MVDEERYDCESKVKKHTNDVGASFKGDGTSAPLASGVPRVSLCLLVDPRTEAEGAGSRRQVQEAGAEEGEGVCG